MSLCVYCSTDEAIQWVLQHPDAGNPPADPVGCITLSNVVTGHVGNFKLRLGDHKEGEGGGEGMPTSRHSRQRKPRQCLQAGARVIRYAPIRAVHGCGDGWSGGGPDFPLLLGGGSLLGTDVAADGEGELRRRAADHRTRLAECRERCTVLLMMDV
jgi:hypothetical protein